MKKRIIAAFLIFSGITFLGQTSIFALILSAVAIQPVQSLPVAAAVISPTTAPVVSTIAAAPAVSTISAPQAVSPIAVMTLSPVVTPTASAISAPPTMPQPRPPVIITLPAPAKSPVFSAR